MDYDDSNDTNKSIKNDETLENFSEDKNIDYDQEADKLGSEGSVDGENAENNDSGKDDSEYAYKDHEEINQDEANQEEDQGEANQDESYKDKDQEEASEDESYKDEENDPNKGTGYIKIHNVPVKKKRFKKMAPFIAAMLISALLGGVAGGAIVSSQINKTAYSSPITSSTNQSKTVSYSSSSLISKIAEEAGPAIVGVDTKAITQDIFGDREVEGSGSGIIFDSKGYIVTNEHVIGNSKDIFVTLPGRKPVKAQVVGADKRTDIAVIKINESNLPVAVFGDSSKVKVGDLAIAIGNPMGEEYAGSVTSGIISALSRNMVVDGKRYKLIQTDAAINPGNSGGALLNERGEVVGINTIKISSSKVEGMGFAIPINEVKPIVEQLMKNGYVSRPYLGIYFFDVTDSMIKDYKLVPGVVIDKVDSGSAAESAGLKPRDIITEVDGNKIKSSDELYDCIQSHKVGDSIKVKVWRDGSTLTIPVTLGDSKGL